MHLYSNTKNILSERHAPLFEHEITLIKNILTSINQLSNDNYTDNLFNTPFYHRDVRYITLGLFQENKLQKYLRLLYIISISLVDMRKKLISIVTPLFRRAQDMIIVIKTSRFY